MYTVASPDPDPNPRGGGQLPDPNECYSTLTSETGDINLIRRNRYPVQKSTETRPVVKYDIGHWIIIIICYQLLQS